MTLAKAVVTGIVYKAPKTGFTANNVAVSSFVLNIGTQDETLIRVISKRQALESVVAGLSKIKKFWLKEDCNVVLAKWMTVQIRKFMRLKLQLSN